MTRFEQEHVNANYRYVAAFGELNARTSQRQQALTVFITFFIGLLAALIAAHNASKGSGDAHIEWILLGFPVASATFAFLNYKYERIITNLRRFLSALEKLNDAHLYLPSYNTNNQWVDDSNHARRFHDYACAILILACNSIGLSAFYVLFPERFQQSIWVLLTVVVVSLLAAGLHWLLPRFGYKAEPDA